MERSAELLGALFVDLTSLVMVLCVLPPLALGTSIGWRIYGRLNEQSFRRVLAALLLLSGLTLALAER